MPRRATLPVFCTHSASVPPNQSCPWGTGGNKRDSLLGDKPNNQMPTEHGLMAVRSHLIQCIFPYLMHHPPH